MSPRRKLAVNVLVSLFMTGSAASLIMQRDFWPFSHYPMFATLQSPELDVLEIVGIDSTGAEEIPLAPSRRSSLVAGTRYRVMLDRLIDNGTEPEIRAYLESAARRYARAQTDDKGTLRVVRLYRSRWQAVPDDEPPARRIGRQLLAEVNLGR